MTIEELSEAPEEIRGRKGFWAASGTRLLVTGLVFALGLICGIPLAMFSMDMIIANAMVIFSLLFGLLVLAAVVVATVIAFRRPILRTVVKRSEVEMERFARPLADVARHAASQNVEGATEAAREVGELMLARFAWVSTRRWMVATITAFVAAIAALSGSVLLLQQNRLLGEQTDRIVEQNGLLSQQIELGEAQRSDTIVPEILDIGDALGTETKALAADGRPASIFSDDELSAGLRARIIAASVAARPYRYLDAALTRAGDAELNALALDRRDDVENAAEAIAHFRANSARILARDPVTAGERLIDRPTSPERGQLISLMFNLRVMSTEYLSFFGADFSFAEVRLKTFGVMSFKHALLRFADFSDAQIREGEFGAAYLEHARFRNCIIGQSHFSGIPDAEVVPPYTPSGDMTHWRTQMAGIDFAGSVIFDTDMTHANVVGGRFDFALIQDVDFTESSLFGATFNGTIFGKADFTNADLTNADFAGAYVFSEDFLDMLAASAASGSFDAASYKLEKVTREALEKAPGALQIWQIPGYPDEIAGIWRIAR